MSEAEGVGVAEEGVEAFECVFESGVAVGESRSILRLVL